MVPLVMGCKQVRVMVAQQLLALSILPMRRAPFDAQRSCIRIGVTVRRGPCALLSKWSGGVLTKSTHAVA